MHAFDRWNDEDLDSTTSDARRTRRGCGYPGTILVFAAALSLSGTTLAFGGPCTEQIAALERQIAQMPPGEKHGPTFSQSLGAQLHYQPTPRDVEHAEQVAKKQADAALDKAKQADAEGNADACKAALLEARRLYGLDD